MEGDATAQQPGLAAGPQGQGEATSPGHGPCQAVSARPIPDGLSCAPAVDTRSPGPAGKVAAWACRGAGAGGLDALRLCGLDDGRPAPGPRPVPPPRRSLIPAHPGAPAPDPAIARVSACTVTGRHGRSGAGGGGPPTPPSVHPGSLGPSLLRGRQSGPSGDLVPVDTPGWSQPLSSKQARPESARGHGARIGLRLQVLHRRFRKGISHRL